MKFFKNLSVAAKLLLLVGPAIVMLLVIPVITGMVGQSIRTKAKQTYYDEIYKNASLIINADRDFYQVMCAELNLVWNESLSDEDRKTQLQNYNDNQNDVIERMGTAIAALEKDKELMNDFKDADTGSTLAELVDSYRSDFQVWKDTYNPETGKGDFNAQLTAFEDARDEIDVMTNILD